MIIILVMVVALTVGLSVASRSIVNVRQSSEEENSDLAFSAAEAGIERTIGKQNGVSGSFSNNTVYQTTVNTVGGTSFLLNNGIPVLKDNASDLWLSNYPAYTNTWNGRFTIYWGNNTQVCNTNESTNTLAALEVILLTGTRNDPKITHYAVDPCMPRSTANKFEFIPQGGNTIEGKSFLYKKTIIVTNGLIARIIPLYAPSVIAVTGCDAQNNNCLSLPSQGRLIESLGKADTTQRKIVRLESNPKLPIELFSYTLFSPN